MTSSFQIEQDRSKSATGPGLSALGAVADGPWPGLATFTENQSEFFHGRDAEVRDLTRRTERNSLTVLFGESGLGKSSLLQAGVFPRLRRAGYWPIYLRLNHGADAPTLTEQIKAIILSDTVRAGTWSEAGSAKPGESLWEFFHHRNDRLLAANGQVLTPVLVFDQFEELFTLGASGGGERARAVAFMNELAELVENRPAGALVARLEDSSAEMEIFDFARTDYRVVISLREDYLPHLESLRMIMPALMENRMRLARMTGVQALEAVVKPGGSLVTDGVARTIVEFVAGSKSGSFQALSELEVEPPLLSVICRELNQRRQGLGQTQITADLVSGNRREILADFYERSVTDLPAAMRAFVEDRLLTKSGFRDNVALETALEEPGVTRSLVDLLVSRRLLRVEERLGVQRIELTHDVLGEVVRASRDERQQRLALADVRRRAAQVHRRLWSARAAAALLLILLVGAGWRGWQTAQGRRADAQRAAEQRRADAHLASRTDIALASSLLEDGAVGDGLAYLVRAAHQDPKNNLLAPRLLWALASRSFLQPEQAPLTLPSPAFLARRTADGKRIFAQSEDMVLRIISVEGWRIERELRYEAPVSPYGWSLAENNSAVFAVELTNGTLVVCATATGQPTLPPFRRPNAAPPFGKRGPNISLSADGRYLSTGDKQKAWAWDTSSGQLTATVSHERMNNWGGYAPSPDGQRMLGVREGNTLFVHAPASGAEIENVAPQNRRQYYGAAFSPDGNKLLVGFAAPPVVKLYDLTLKQWETPEFKTGEVDQVVFSPDGRRYALAKKDGQALIMDAATARPLVPPLRHSGPVYDPQFSADGKTLMTSSTDGLTRLWDAETGRPLIEPALSRERSLPTVLMPDGRSIVSFAESGRIYRWRVGRSASEPLTLPRTPSTVGLSAFMDRMPVRLIWMTPDRARVIDLVAGKEIGGFPLPQALDSPLRVTGLNDSEFLGDGETLFALAGGNGWHAWKFSGQKIVQDVLMPSAPTSFIHTSKNLEGSRAVFMYSTRSENFTIQDPATGKTVSEINLGVSFVGGPRQVRFSPDGRYVLARGSDFSVKICNLSTGAVIHSLKGSDRDRSELGVFEWSNDSTKVFTGDVAGSVHVWDAGTGKRVRSSLHHRSSVDGITVSADGKYFASHSAAGSVQVWFTADGEPSGANLKHGRPVRFVRFSPDSTRILIGLDDGAARLWDVASSQPLTETLLLDNDVPTGGGFSPDGRFAMLKSGSRGGSHRVWSLPPSGGGNAVPEWLLRFATICAGRRVTENGTMLDVDDSFELRELIRAELAALPSDAPYVDWGHWLLSDTAIQSIAPGFNVTAADARRLRDSLATGKTEGTGPLGENPAKPPGEP